LFRAGHIDEGIAFLKKMLPPQTPAEGMLALGYVSESLLEQKRFEEAWQLADNGPPQERADNIVQYIQRTIAKNYYEKEPSNHAWIPHLPPYIPKKDDAEIYRAEANRALERLKKLLEQNAADQEQVRVVSNQSAEVINSHAAKNLIAQSLAAVGRSDEAYALVKDEQYPSEILRIILKERCENGTPEEVERWFQKVRKLYDEGKINDGHVPPETTFIWYCLDAGKYLDAMDAIEGFAKRSGGSERGWTGSPDGYFDRIPKHNLETGFRYNSKELLDRMIKYHDKSVDEEGVFVIKGQRIRQNRFKFYSHIVKAQLNLGLVDDALESLRKITSSLEALEALGDIMFYVLKHKTPKEASRIEAAAIKIFKNVGELKSKVTIVNNGKVVGEEEHYMGDYLLVNYYAQLAVRLMKDGEAEKGAKYLKTALDWAEAEQVRQEKKEGRELSSSQVERVCVALISDGYLDEAAEIADRIEKRYLMPNLHLQIAEKRAAAGETEKAKAALRKAFETLSRVEGFFCHPLDYNTYARMATLAAGFNDKEFFYEIMNAGMKIADRDNWCDSGYRCSGPLSIFARQLAVYGDKEHPLFVQAEKYADGFKEMNQKADLYFSLGVSRAMLGDHENARRLLKKGIEARQKDEFKSVSSGFCSAIIEARSYEKQNRR